MKIYIFIFLFLGSSLTISAQQHIRILNSQSSIEWLKSIAGKPSTAIRMVTVKIDYWSDKKTGNIDQQRSFTVSSSAAAKFSNPEIYVNPFVLVAKDFDSLHKDTSIDIPITIKAITNYESEFFNIGLKDQDTLVEISIGGSHGVTIQDKPVNEQVNKTPDGFTILNAMNFNFDGIGGSSYVGHLNIFKPDALSEKKVKIGLNVGIMKINFSRNDSLNKNYDYFENVMLHPLDSVKEGKYFLRQYNKINTISKNMTWSFYFQPTFSIIYNNRVKFLFHLHTELFVDRWNTTTAISNYQQDSSIITAGNLSLIKDSMGLLNKFSKSTSDVISSFSSSTVLNFNFGAGFILDVNLWDGASLFVQPTIGWAFDYARPLSINNKNLNYNPTPKQNIFAHLTRFNLKQKLNSNLQAIIGIDVRGKFGKDPTYAAYIGFNIGLDGLKKLIN